MTLKDLRRQLLAAYASHIETNDFDAALTDADKMRYVLRDAELAASMRHKVQLHIDNHPL